MSYKASAHSKEEQKYYWRNPNNMFDVAYGLERHYPGWIATDFMMEQNGVPMMVRAYKPSVPEDPEPTIPEPTIQLRLCKFRGKCPFHTI